MAAQLSKEKDVAVETVRGGMGELSVSIDGRKVIDTNRFLYPTPGKMAARTRSLLAAKSP